VAAADSSDGECRELGPGRYRVSFFLGDEATAYASLARLLERVRHWRATEVYEEDELVSSYQAREMAWCASFQLSTFGDCRERFLHGVLPRCDLCPLFDAERAIRAGREQPPPAEHVQLTLRQDDADIIEPDFSIIDLDFLFNPDLLAQLDGVIPDWIDLSQFVPDSPPEQWPEPTDDDEQN
jgi:hypothetical protein